MRIVHLSDLHLGFRAYERTHRGWNLRERDLSTALRRAFEDVARVDPGIVLISGDVFDRPDPPPTAILSATRALSNLCGQLRGVPVLVIAGERDTPHSPADPGPVALLDGLPGVEAAAGAPRSVRFRESGLHVLLVPHRATARAPFPEIRPDPDARWNVLVIRGRPRAPRAISIDVDEWDYLAVGGPHTAQRWYPHVCAAGALERPGWDPWSETLEERGFSVYDLARRTYEMHPVSGRAVLDLAPVRVTPGDREAGTRRLRELLQGVPGGIAGKLVRIPLRGDILAPGEGVSPGLLEAVRGRAAHLEIELRGPGQSGPGPGSPGPSDRVEDQRARGKPRHWRPTALHVGSGAGATKAARESVEPVRLDGSAFVLVTSPSDSDRLRAAAALGAPVSGIGRWSSSYGLRLRPDPPQDLRSRSLWAGEWDPVKLLLSTRPAAPPTASGPAGTEHPTAEVSAQSPEALDATLRELRGDAIEASGDLEARTMEWARERQDAESKLQAYRSKARELQDRLQELEGEGPSAECPTCGQPLGRHLDDLLGTLRDELEAVVQDGRWWRSRREQLEGKPDQIRSLEARVLRLHAELEEMAERAQRARDEVAQVREGLAAPGEDPTGPGVLGGIERLADPGSRDALREVATALARMTESRLVGVRLDERGLSVVDRGGEARSAIGVEVAALRFAVHLAMWREAWRRNEGVEGLLVWEFFRAGAEEIALPALELLAESVPEGLPVVVIAPRLVAERIPEVFGEVVELDGGTVGRPQFRRHAPRLSGLELLAASARASRSDPH